MSLSLTKRFEVELWHDGHAHVNDPKELVVEALSHELPTEVKYEQSCKRSVNYCRAALKLINLRRAFGTGGYQDKEVRCSEVFVLDEHSDEQRRENQSGPDDIPAESIAKHRRESEHDCAAEQHMLNVRNLQVLLLK